VSLVLRCTPKIATVVELLGPETDATGGVTCDEAVIELEREDTGSWGTPSD
jgi:hypothetical protein